MHNVLPDLVVVGSLWLLCAGYLWVDSKKPTHGCNREQATRVTKTNTQVN